MANDSSFWGELRVIGPWDEEDLNTLEDIITYMETFRFNFWSDNFNKVSLAMGDSIPLSGNGRWSIQTNIENFLTWARMKDTERFNENLQHSQSVSEYNQRLDALIEKMRLNKDMYIAISGFDMEGGMDFVYSFDSAIYVKDDGTHGYDYEELDSGNCTLIDYEHVTDSDEYLEEAVGTLRNIFNMDPKYDAKIYEMIKRHDEMYGISIWAPWSNDLDEFLDNIRGDENKKQFKTDMEKLYLESLRA